MRYAWLLAVLSFAGCASDPTPVDASDLTRLTDTNAAPDVVEVELIAVSATAELLPGTTADVWAFRDGAGDGPAAIPGPLLEANAGDTVIVHFTNELPEETTIHWHGLRVPNASDGTPASQETVPPGGTYDYEFTVPDAGLYWYHPHMRADVQIERGLYAPILVHDDAAIDVAADRVFVLDDVKLEASGQLSTTTDQLDIMLGRQGNVLLVNGRRGPTLHVAAGTRERWRFVNVANGRYFHLDLPGHTFQVIGWDDGLVTTPYDTDTLLIAPGERYDVLVELDDSPGAELEVRNVYYDRGHNIPDPGPVSLMTVEVGNAGAPPAALPSSWGSVPAIATDETTAHRTLVLREQDEGVAEPVFSINDEQFPDITPLAISEGAIEIWDLDNETEMDHPFHLHGTSFQVLGDVAPIGWKDTVNVPQMSTLSIAIRFDAAGRWMYHCHILEHAERGMMGEADVAASP